MSFFIAPSHILLFFSLMPLCLIHHQPQLSTLLYFLLFKNYKTQFKVPYCSQCLSWSLSEICLELCSNLEQRERDPTFSLWSMHNGTPQLHKCLRTILRYHLLYYLFIQLVSWQIEHLLCARSNNILFSIFLQRKYNMPHCGNSQTLLLGSGHKAITKVNILALEF